MGQDESYLDDAVLPRVGVECVLDVTLAHNTEMSNDIYRRRSEHVIIHIRQRLRWSDDDRIACMDTQRIKVLFHELDNDRQ